MKKSALLLSAMLTLPQFATANTEYDVKRVFDAFVAAQNTHDPKAVSNMLHDSPNLLWITRGTAIWGREAALKRFETLYQGTWKLVPEAGAFKVVVLGLDTAQVFIPRRCAWSRPTAARLHKVLTAKRVVSCRDGGRHARRFRDAVRPDARPRSRKERGSTARLAQHLALNDLVQALGQRLWPTGNATRH